MTRKYTKRAAKWFSKEEPKAKRKYRKRAKVEQSANVMALTSEYDLVSAVRSVDETLKSLGLNISGIYETLTKIQQQDAQLIVADGSAKAALDEVIKSGRKAVRIKVTPDMAPEDIGERIRDEAELRYEPDPDAAHA